MYYDDPIETEAARLVKIRRRLSAEGIDTATIDKNMLRCLLWNNWTKEQANQIIKKAKEIEQC